MSKLSRRDVLKLGGLSLGSLAFTPKLNLELGFDDSNLVRVATNSVSIYTKPDDQSRIVSTWYRDELLHTYGEVTASEPKLNPVWYRVWGGFIHRSHLQPVNVTSGEGTRRHDPQTCQVRCSSPHVPDPASPPVGWQTVIGSTVRWPSGNMARCCRPASTRWVA